MSWTLLQNSLLVAAGSTLLAGGAGFFAALGLAGCGARLRYLLLGLPVIALAMPPFLVTNCWLGLLGAAGPLRGWIPLPIGSLGGTVLILALLFWPITMFATLAAWQQLQSAHLEGEPALDGWRLIRWLLWPLARPAALGAAVLTFVLALNNFAVPAILQVKVLPAAVWISFNTHLDPAQAILMGWPLVLAPFLFLLLLRRGPKARWPRLETEVASGVFRRQLGRGWLAASAGVAVLFIGLSVVVPLGRLAADRRTWLELWAAFAAGKSAVAHSVFFAMGAATLVLAGCLLAAGRPEANARSRRFAAAAWLWLPLFIPGIFLGILFIWLFNRPGLDWLYCSPVLVVVALGIRYLAPAWFGTAAAFGGLDRDLLDAARLEGAHGWRLLRHAIWPQVERQVFTAWYVVFLLCLWDVETLLLILPPGGETLASRLFNLLHYGHSGQANALCLWLLALAVLPLALWPLAEAGGILRRILPPGRGLRPASSSLLLLLALSGCSPGPSSATDLLHSRLFQRVEVIGRRGVGAGEFSKPRSLALDTNDNLYAADMTGRIQKFSPDGNYLLSWQMPQTDLGKPKGMDRDRDGNIIVIEPHYQRINHFSPEGRLVAQWGGHLTNGGPFSLPRAVAVNSRGELIVSEYTLAERVQVFPPHDPKPLFAFGRPGTGPGEFNRAEGVAVDSADRIYVADSCNHRIQVFTPAGRFLRAHGQPGRGPGQFSYPYDIRVDAAGRQYVCEFGNSRIQVFDAGDNLLETLGGPGTGVGRFHNPWGLALDARGNLYVADSQNHRVQKFLRREPVAARAGRDAFQAALPWPPSPLAAR